MRQQRADRVHTYLRKHACAEAHAIELPQEPRYARAAVVPCCNESPATVGALLSSVALAAGPDATLAIVVVNQTRHAASAVRQQNAALLRSLLAGCKATRRWSRMPPISWGQGFDAHARRHSGRQTLAAIDLMLVDRANPGFELPARSGVGLARRVGFDLALRLVDEGMVKSPWIASMDADSRLPLDYFSAFLHVSPNTVAQTFPFQHLPCELEPTSQELAVATALYELGLHYYALGLRRAASPFEWQSLGSALAARADAYAAVHGFDDRQTGEDFYLLNKLAKIGTIERARTAPIRIAVRASQRVPVGTAIAAQGIASTLQRQADFCLPHPEVFTLLAAWNEALKRWAIEAPERIGDEALGKTPTRWQAAMRRTVERITGERRWQRWLSAWRRGRLVRHDPFAWFDALQTRRFVNDLRRHGLRDQPWHMALGELAGPRFRACATVAYATKRSQLLRELQRINADLRTEECQPPRPRATVSIR